MQRSSDGIQYITIDNVKPGNLSQGNSYTIQDKKPLTGYNYYRLKILDINGTFIYSIIETVYNRVGDALIASSVYPNPGKGQVTIQLSKVAAGDVRIKVLNQSGMQMFSKSMHHDNSGRFGAVLDLQRLPKGNYILKVEANEKAYMHRLLIQ